MKVSRWTALAAMALALSTSACAGVAARMEPPEVSLSDIRLVEATPLEQRYLFTLRIRNPNQRSLRVEGLQFDLSINQRSFASGVSNAHVTVPAFGEERVEVSATSTLLGLLRQLQELGRAETLRYRLKGRIASPDVHAPLDFERHGEISLEGGGDGAGSIRIRAPAPPPSEPARSV